MKVTLETYGGFAAGIRRPPQVVDTSALSAAEAAELARRVAAAAAAPPPTLAPAVRDGMSYEVRVEDTDEPVVLEQSDGAMSAEFTALVDWLANHGSP